MADITVGYIPKAAEEPKEAEAAAEATGTAEEPKEAPAAKKTTRKQAAKKADEPAVVDEP